MRRFFPTFAFCLALAACARYAEVGTEPVGPGYVTGGGEWSSGGGITVVARAFERGGATVICGAWTTDQQSVLTVSLNEQVIDAGTVYLGRRVAVRGLGFMPRLHYAADLSGAPAGCVASALPWRLEYAAAGPEIRLPSMRFTAGSRSANVVRFDAAPRPVAVP